MEKTLAKLNEQWSTIEFEFESHKGSEVMLMKIKDDDFEMLEEHQVGDKMQVEEDLAVYEPHMDQLLGVVLVQNLH